METTSSKSLRVADAHRRFFASKADYLAYRAAWSALTGSGVQLTASHYAAHALLSGRDLYRAFGRNQRGNGQPAYGALTRAVAGIGRGLTDAWSHEGHTAPAGAVDALVALASFLYGETTFTALTSGSPSIYAIQAALLTPSGLAISRGEFSFSNAAEVTHA